ncbi:TldD/PmbA family protein [Synechococcus sp. CS-1325]|uniref:TldD/PmbA family protein n=1 Tax=unclassified Synechococcus TaxID=2626047 RepID=UPI000DB154F4|nr:MULTISPECIES: TldD/PmbA family protein [unclassified Synechococcus]MCT0199693.1 TldD/PmbA family protein [Synechococcus sp. CS-1325]MCT0231617.1 TldD/PmbA family protein [Synechococcus sp. CS-1324]PZV01004.1 MAG: peptidase C69 [Cyanobium sp.]PZV02878.1 MAG: peptidase C69 [Cyanobium sp.]
MTSSTASVAVLDASRLGHQLEQLAAGLGIERWDLGAACSTDTSVQVDRGEAKQLKGAQRSSITVRVWNGDGLVGITSTSDLSPAGLARALGIAHEASAYGNADETPSFSPLATAALQPLDQPLLEPVGILSLLDTLKEAERVLLSRHEAISTVPYNGLAQRSSDRIYLNSAGACRQQRLSTASVYLYARAEQAGRKPRSSGAVRLAYGASQLDLAGCIEEAAERTISHLDYAPIDTGYYTCVFSPEAFLDLIGAFSSLFNARAVLDGVSLSNRESLGEQLAVPFLSIHDNGLHPGNIGASAFDGEGTPVQRLALVDGGVLRQFIHSEATARAFGVAPTGHAGLGAKVSVGANWLEIGPGSSSGGSSGLDRHKADGVVWIDSLSALHAGVKPSQGSFSLPFDGWLIQGGEPRSIEAATVAGDIRTVLNSLLGFEGPGKITPDGLCPHVWVEGLSITGDA